MQRWWGGWCWWLRGGTRLLLLLKLVLQLLLLMLLLLLVALLGVLVLAVGRLLQGGCRARFPLKDPLLHRWLIRLQVLVGRGVSCAGIEVGRILIPRVGIFGVEVSDHASCRARVFGFADAGSLAPTVSPRAPRGLKGRQDSSQQAEKEEPRPGSTSSQAEPGARGRTWR